MNAEKLAKIIESAGVAEKPFKPLSFYERDGDCIEFIFKPDSYYAERIDGLVTVYYSHETHEIIGSQIKGVSRFSRKMAKKLPGFAIGIEDGPVRLEHLFLIKMWTDAELQPILRKTYKKLAEAAERAEAEARIA